MENVDISNKDTDSSETLAKIIFYENELSRKDKITQRR